MTDDKGVKMSNKKKRKTKVFSEFAPIFRPVHVEVLREHSDTTLERLMLVRPIQYSDQCMSIYVR